MSKDEFHYSKFFTTVGYLSYNSELL